MCRFNLNLCGILSTESHEGIILLLHYLVHLLWWPTLVTRFFVSTLTHWSRNQAAMQSDDVFWCPFIMHKTRHLHAYMVPFEFHFSPIRIYSNFTLIALFQTFWSKATFLALETMWRQPLADYQIIQLNHGLTDSLIKFVIVECSAANSPFVGKNREATETFCCIFIIRTSQHRQL